MMMTPDEQAISAAALSACVADFHLFDFIDEISDAHLYADPAVGPCERRASPLRAARRRAPRSAKNAVDPRGGLTPTRAWALARDSRSCYLCADPTPRVLRLCSKQSRGEEGHMRLKTDRCPVCGERAASVTQVMQIRSAIEPDGDGVYVFVGWFDEVEGSARTPRGRGAAVEVHCEDGHSWTSETLV